MFFKNKMSFPNWGLGPRLKRIKENGFCWLLWAMDKVLWAKFSSLIRNSGKWPVESLIKKTFLRLCFVRNKEHEFLLCLFTSKIYLKLWNTACRVSAKQAHPFVCMARFSEMLILHRRTKRSSQSHELSPQRTSVAAVLWWQPGRLWQPWGRPEASSGHRHIRPYWLWALF